MTMTITMSLDNAAFDDGAGNVNGYEVARILRDWSKCIDNETLDAGDDWPLMDANGNKVGQVAIA